MKNVTHVIFDVDGLLLDTEIFYTEVNQIIASRYGKVFDWNIKANMLGQRAIESARYLVKALELPITAEEYLQMREAMLQEMFPNAKPMPGAKQLTLHFHQQQVPQAIGTSSNKDMFVLKTQQHQQWLQQFKVIITGDHPQVKNGKPAPDIFLVAAEKMGALPQNCLVFEDAPSGVSAAKAAGMQVVAVPDPNMDKSRYSAADLVLDSLEQFNPQDFGLPK